VRGFVKLILFFCSGVVMNFPVGTVVFKGSSPYKLEEIAANAIGKKFNGYIIQSISAHFIEEGVLFFRDGEMVACVAECLALSKSFKGKEALDFFLNQTKGKGFFQVVDLSRSQVDLVTAFDEKLLLGEKLALKDLPKLIPVTFSNRFEPSEKGSDLLETYGLSELKS